MYEEDVITQEEKGVRTSTILMVVGLIIFIVSLIILLVSGLKEKEQNKANTPSVTPQHKVAS